MKTLYLKTTIILISVLTLIITVVSFWPNQTDETEKASQIIQRRLEQNLPVEVTREWVDEQNITQPEKLYRTALFYNQSSGPENLRHIKTVDCAKQIIEDYPDTEQAESSGIGDNIKVVINMLSTDAADSFAIDSLFQYVDENLSIAKNPQLMTGSGFTIGVADSNFRAQLNITKTQLRFSEETQLLLLLADGTSGYINIGEEIVVPQFSYSNQWYTSKVYDFRRAGRSLKVTAQKLPSGHVYMELTPVFSNFLSDGGDLELTELSTTVTVSPSQTLVIGGGDTSTENVATALLAYQKSGRQRKTLITVTPYIR
jgi:hypothetical protein